MERGQDVDLRHEGVHVVKIHVARLGVQFVELFGGPEKNALRIVVGDAHAAQGRTHDHVDHAVLVGAEKFLSGMPQAAKTMPCATG